MRPVLLALLVATAAAAQPTADRTAALVVRPASPIPASLADEPPAAYRAAVATAMAAPSAVAVAGLATLGVLMAEASSCGLGGCTERTDRSAEYLIIGALGGFVGASGSILLLGSEPEDYRGILPYHGIRRSDARWALAGAAAGTVVGVLVTLAVPSTQSELEALAVPIAQGVGAGLAVGLSPR